MTSLSLKEFLSCYKITVFIPKKNPPVKPGFLNVVNKQIHSSKMQFAFAKI